MVSFLIPHFTSINLLHPLGSLKDTALYLCSRVCFTRPISQTFMAILTYHSGQSSSHRSMAMALALASAIVLSPLYVKRKSESRHEARWSSGFVLPMVLGGLIIAIRAASWSSSSMQRGGRGQLFPSLDDSFVLRIGRSSWGLAGVLAMLLLVLSWQDSVQEFLWK